MKKIPVTLACGDYEIVRALKEGIVEPDGIDLTVLTAMDSYRVRHTSPRANTIYRSARSRSFSIAGFATASSLRIRPQASPNRPI
jgi:4,5-dihydroxyphthalate decarboxylase